MIDQELALKLVQGKPWHHDFEIIPGVRTHGSYDPSGLWSQLRLPPDLSGLSVADVGASNGYFSFEAQRRGARVVAFDFRNKDNSGFGLAQHINGLSEIEHHQINVLEIAVDRFGQFDIVLALGLLYHVSDPYLALANCAAISRDRLLIESHCVDNELPRRLASRPVMQFFPDAERFPMQGQPNADRSNFWGFTSTCLKRMVEDVGFAVTAKSVSKTRVLIDAKRDVFDQAETRLSIAYGSLPTVAVDGNPDHPEAWTIF